jgi:hypothetical protein
MTVCIGQVFKDGAIQSKCEDIFIVSAGDGS